MADKERKWRLVGVWNAGLRAPCGLWEHALSLWNSYIVRGAYCSPPPKQEGHIRFVCMSDSHNSHNTTPIPDGDVFLHCGDFTFGGEKEEIENFASWLEKLPHKARVVISGSAKYQLWGRRGPGDPSLTAEALWAHSNHDLALDPQCGYFQHGLKDAMQKRFSVAEAEPRIRRACPKPGAYLKHEAIEIKGVNIFGSPHTTGGAWAFALPPSDANARKSHWASLPEEIDVLVTHMPPKGHGSMTHSLDDAGCEYLYEEAVERRVLVHVFGHIHEAYGVSTSPDGQTVFINTATHTINRPIVFDLARTDR